MMLNQELIKEYDVETLSARLKDLLRKEYRKVANTDKRQVPGLFVRYDRGSSSTAITSYLRTIKEAYLQVRGEISGELGGVSEARLDSFASYIRFFLENLRFTVLNIRRLRIYFYP